MRYRYGSPRGESRRVTGLPVRLQGRAYANQESTWDELGSCKNKDARLPVVFSSEPYLLARGGGLPRICRTRAGTGATKEPGRFLACLIHCNPLSFRQGRRGIYAPGFQGERPLDVHACPRCQNKRNGRKDSGE